MAEPAKSSADANPAATARTPKRVTTPTLTPVFRKGKRDVYPSSRSGTGPVGNGNVIAYDPAHDTDGEVRQVYDRTEFERAWIPASGGIVYVIRPANHALPSLTANNS